MRNISIPVIVTMACVLGACALPRGTQLVVVGESGATGAAAAAQANQFIANAEQSGCEAVSVGGYAAGAKAEGGGLLIGIPVLLECPQGTSLLPDGSRAP